MFIFPGQVDKDLGFSDEGGRSFTLNTGRKKETFLTIPKDKMEHYKVGRAHDAVFWRLYHTDTTLNTGTVVYLKSVCGGDELGHMDNWGQKQYQNSWNPKEFSGYAKTELCEHNNQFLRNSNRYNNDFNNLFDGAPDRVLTTKVVDGTYEGTLEPDQTYAARSDVKNFARDAGWKIIPVGSTKIDAPANANCDGTNQACKGSLSFKLQSVADKTVFLGGVNALKNTAVVHNVSYSDCPPHAPIPLLTKDNVDICVSKNYPTDMMGYKSHTITEHGVRAAAGLIFGLFGNTSETFSMTFPNRSPTPSLWTL